jgi:hypothetical protein
MARIEYKEITKDGITQIKEIHEIVVHRFSLSEDVDEAVYMAEPIYQWQQTEAGKFIMNNAEDAPKIQSHFEYQSFSKQIAILAKLEKKKLTEYYLRFDKMAKI